jgi:hypothetical protein
MSPALVDAVSAPLAVRTGRPTTIPAEFSASDIASEPSSSDRRESGAIRSE